MWVLSSHFTYNRQITLMITTYMVRLFTGLNGIAFVNLLGGEGFRAERFMPSLFLKWLWPIVGCVSHIIINHTKQPVNIIKKIRSNFFKITFSVKLQLKSINTLIPAPT